MPLHDIALLTECGVGQLVHSRWDPTLELQLDLLAIQPELLLQQPEHELVSHGVDMEP